MPGLRLSPLDRAHRALNAKMVEFGGWDMPVAYPTGTIAEHLACRSNAVVFDVSHLGTVRIEGYYAKAALQGVLTNDLDKIEVGRAQYTHLLNDQGCVLDDIIVWWIKENLWPLALALPTRHEWPSRLLLRSPTQHGRYSRR